MNPQGGQKGLAVIPARGGSKRISGKNIKPFCGRPMIEYAIDVAQRSGLFTRIVVSTDSEDIATVARQAGAEVPFERPASLSDDHTTTAAVLQHALAELGATGTHDYACCIYPAVPFLRARDLRAGYDLVETGETGSVFACSEFDAPIWRAFERRSDGTFGLLWPEYRDTRSQDLPAAVHDLGQFYWVPVSGFMADPVLFTGTSRGVPIERHRAHDIDTPEDWRRAELVYRALVDETPTENTND
jgi:pseudaminic acid cytidylyltransferase